MKILHCADLHLDSKLESNLSREQAKERRAEILNTFVNMVAYAEQNGIGIILIAGDLFDRKNISAMARNVVLNAILENQEITFYYLKGNHDSDGFLASLKTIPDNLRTFTDEWTTYVEPGKMHVFSDDDACTGDGYGDTVFYNTGNNSVDDTGILTISGSEKPENYHSLVLDSSNINIVMLHGQEADNDMGNHTEIINLRELRNKGIDYLALGHIHSYKKEKLDARGVYCYPGCLEGRGFDECGEHGFSVLDIDFNTRSISSEFVPFAKRNLYSLMVDVSGCGTTAGMMNRIRSEISHAGCAGKDLLKIVLCGMLDVECEKNTEYILASLKDDFYFVKVSDETKLRMDVRDYLLDASLKGEFVRSVLEDESIPEEDRTEIIRYGLLVLMGEEV